MIDSHCHLADRYFADDLDEVVARAVDGGVTGMVTIADNLNEAEKCLQIAEKYDHIFYTAGVHPHAAKLWKDGDEQRVEELLDASPKAVAVGEIGLDYHYDNSPRDVQQSVFKLQLELAKKRNLPAVLHCREAIDDLTRIIKEVDPSQLVLHCCTEKWDDVSVLVERGYLLSFTGIVTYKWAQHIRDVAMRCPLTQLMVETDAPYLTPEPYRGKRCEPVHVMDTAEFIAELRGISIEELDRQTTENARKFYSIK